MAKIVEYEEPFVKKAYQEITSNNLKAEDFNFISFIIKIPESDEFLVDVGKKGIGVFYKWGKGTPSIAKRITRFKKAEQLASEIGKGARTELLFESESQFIAIPALT